METPPKDDGKSAGPKPRAKVRASLIATIALIAAAGAAYYMFYRGQAGYYAGRNLRVISTLAAQIGGRVAMYSRQFQDGTLEPDNKDGNAISEPLQLSLTEKDRGWGLLLQDQSGHTKFIQIEDVLRPLFAHRVSTTFDMV